MQTTAGPGGDPTRKLEKKLDPFGIGDSCIEVQKAWLQEPARLAQEVMKLTTGFWAVQLQSWQKIMGGGKNEDVVAAVKTDERFQAPIWTQNAYLDTLKEHYLLYTRWLENAIFATPDLDEKTRRKAAFWVRQALNAASPTNYFWTNPAAVVRAFETGGQSLVNGMKNFLSDLPGGTIRMVDESPFQVGQNLATTPGAVVFRNEVVELIQYAPTTDKVHPVPIVLVSPWINKFYILDLDRKKSLVRFLVDQGFTVFITSWKNPGPELRDTTLDDYMLKGVLESVQAAREICKAPHVHLTGYCIGGTMVAALMAWLNRQGAGKKDDPVAHWSVLTTLVDFSNPGDVDVFISEAGIEHLEKNMAQEGYLDGKDMSTTFRMLRSNSLIWHYFVHNYLYGETPPALDVLFWNCDTTRMPDAMHSFYLREFYLENKLSKKDGVTLGGRPIDLRRITQPLYAVGTEEDHIAPWKETFKICSLVKGPVRYALATSGHILGIVNPPVDPPKRKYTAADAAGHGDAAAWAAGLTKTPGSWWPDWVEWLRPQCGEPAPPPRLGSTRNPRLADAPGTYVLER